MIVLLCAGHPNPEGGRYGEGTLWSASFTTIRNLTFEDNLSIAGGAIQVESTVVDNDHVKGGFNAYDCT
jgi:predicted outer membrane repeat protein